MTPPQQNRKLHQPGSLLPAELVISILLRGGVFTCSLIIAAGFILQILQVPALSNDLIKAGLVLLISLPIIRVGMTVLLFLIERDWVFMFITLFVLMVLLGSIFYGKLN